ncbi:unnamed protein product, partial [Prorocentrum cordatum]
VELLDGRRGRYLNLFDVLRCCGQVRQGRGAGVAGAAAEFIHALRFVIVVLVRKLFG